MRESWNSEAQAFRDEVARLKEVEESLTAELVAANQPHQHVDVEVDVDVDVEREAEVQRQEREKRRKDKAATNALVREYQVKLQLLRDEKRAMFEVITRLQADNQRLQPT